MLCTYLSLHTAANSLALFCCFFFSLSSSNNLALHPNICVGSAQGESVMSCYGDKVVPVWGAHFGLSRRFPVGRWDPPVPHSWESLDSSPRFGCTRVEHIPSTFSWQRWELSSPSRAAGFSLQQSQGNLPDFLGNIKPQAEAL